MFGQERLLAKKNCGNASLLRALGLLAYGPAPPPATLEPQFISGAALRASSRLTVDVERCSSGPRTEAVRKRFCFAWAHLTSKGVALQI